MFAEVVLKHFVFVVPIFYLRLFCFEILSFSRIFFRQMKLELHES